MRNWRRCGELWCRWNSTAALRGIVGVLGRRGGMRGRGGAARLTSVRGGNSCAVAPVLEDTPLGAFALASLTAAAGITETGTAAGAPADCSASPTTFACTTVSTRLSAVQHTQTQHTAHESSVTNHPARAIGATNAGMDVNHCWSDDGCSGADESTTSSTPHTPTPAASALRPSCSRPAVMLPPLAATDRTRVTWISSNRRNGTFVPAK